MNPQQRNGLVVGISVCRLQPHELKLRCDVSSCQFPAPGSGGSTLQKVVRKEANVSPDPLRLQIRPGGRFLPLAQQEKGCHKKSETRNADGAQRIRE